MRHACDVNAAKSVKGTVLGLLTLLAAEGKLM